MLSRREALVRIGSAAGAAALGSRSVLAQGPGSGKAAPPSVISNPPRDFSGPVTYPDPDIITHDPAFNSLRVGNTPIQRLWTGGMWCEGPAWNGQGRYLIWSDIPNNRQMRWIEEDGRVTVRRPQPSRIATSPCSVTPMPRVPATGC
jgi:gluconolactonase